MSSPLLTSDLPTSDMETTANSLCVVLVQKVHMLLAPAAVPADDDEKEDDDNGGDDDDDVNKDIDNDGMIMIEDDSTGNF